MKLNQNQNIKLSLKIISKKFKSDNQELKNPEIFKLLAQEWKKSKV